MADRGLFVSFEGPEGGGKSLQAGLLAERIAGLGGEVVRTREPGGTELGDALRELLLLRPDLQPGARSEALMMCAARAQLVDRVIRPALERGAVVLCDRFADSTLAYQGFGRGLDVESLRAVICFATDGLWPDVTFLLDLPAARGLARKRAQEAAQAPAWNRFEAEDLAFHERVREGYRALATREPERWRVLDAEAPPERLASEIWSAVGGHLKP